MYALNYGPAMRAFTKKFKVPFSHLLHLEHRSVVYVDDSYLQGDSCKAYFDNVIETVKVLRKLGFIIHTEKSVIIPKQ